MHWYTYTTALTVYLGLGLSLVAAYIEAEHFDSFLVVLVLLAVWPGLFIVLLLKRLGIEALFSWVVNPPSR